MTHKVNIGKMAVLLATLTDEEIIHFEGQLKGYTYCSGKAGSMNMQKVISSVETAAKRNGLIQDEVYRETHALYHAILEALEGVTRGQLAIGDTMRTVGLRFTVVRGRPYDKPQEGEWIAVSFYGTIGLGINHI